jgi:hypothetical protein
MRPSFTEAVSGFRRFLSQSGWSDAIRWISASDITGHRNQYWIFRPSQLENEQLSEAFYHAAIATPSSVRLDALFQHEGYTIAWVEDYGGDSRSLNYGISTSSSLLTPVTSRFVWHLRRATNRVRGVSPLLRHCTIPTRH